MGQGKIDKALRHFQNAWIPAKARTAAGKERLVRKTTPKIAKAACKSFDSVAAKFYKYLVICRIKNTVCQIRCHAPRRFQQIASDR
jgi:hypothetical protein